MYTPKNNAPLPGFPRKGKFQTREEVDSYFSGDKIQCLLCGKWFQQISGNHLKFKHEIDNDDYREMYGLPWLRGLVGKRLHERNVEMGKRAYAKSGKTENLKKLHESKPSPARPHQPFQRDFLSRLALRNHNLSGHYREEDFEAILERMREQKRTFNDVCNDPDMPSRLSWREYKIRSPGLEEKAREVTYGLPYPLQAKCRNFSPQFKLDCQDMRARGMSLNKIARTLGLSTNPVRQALEESPGGFIKMDRKGPRKWRLEDFESLLDRMRKQQRTLRDVCNDSDLPTYKSWWILTKDHPELKEKAKKLQIRLPYALQLKIKCVSPRFAIDCRRLRTKGMSQVAIAEALGVSAVSVRKALEGAPGGLSLLEPQYFRKWLRRDYEAILERMRSQQRTLPDVCKDPDLPSQWLWIIFKKENLEMEEKYRQTVYSLPYHVQLKTFTLSPEFLDTCQSMRSRGMSFMEIASELGIKKSAVKRVFRNIKKRNDEVRSKGK